MRIWLFSDLHLPGEHIAADALFPEIPECDVAIVAGDIIDGDPAASVRWLAKYVHPHVPAVVLVMGNHDFFDTERTRSMERLRGEAGRAAVQCGIDVLDDMALSIDGMRILGSTLWSAPQASHGERDYEWIRPIDGSTQMWTAATSRSAHEASVGWLERELAASDLPTVVVSHHAPHPDCVDPKFAGKSDGYASDLSELIVRHQPAAWLHGHTHVASDFTIGGTRVTSNQRGHHWDRDTGWDPCRVIEIDSYRPRLKI